MNLSSWSFAVSGRPPTGLDVESAVSTSLSHISISCTSWLNAWASLRASSSSACLSSPFPRRAFHFEFSSFSFCWVWEASLEPFSVSMICLPASFSVSTLDWWACMSFTITFSLASSTSMTWGSPYTGLRLSSVLSVLSIHTRSSLRACWNWPSLSRACSSSFCLTTIALLRSVQRLLTSASGSLIALAWSGEVLSVKSSACLLSASTFTIQGSTSSLNFLSSSICFLTVAISDPIAPMLSYLVSLLARNSRRLWSISWNSIAFSIASRRFFSRLAYMEVTLSQALSSSSICLLSSGFSASPTTDNRSDPESLHLSTAGLVPSIPLLISWSSLFCASIAFGSTAGGSWEARWRSRSLRFDITCCSSSQNFSARAKASSRLSPRFLAMPCTSFHRPQSLSSFFLISLTAGSCLFGAFWMTSSAALLTASYATSFLPRSSRIALLSSICSLIFSGWADMGSARASWSFVSSRELSMPSSLSVNCEQSCMASSKACILSLRSAFRLLYLWLSVSTMSWTLSASSSTIRRRRAPPVLFSLSKTGLWSWTDCIRDLTISCCFAIWSGRIPGFIWVMTSLSMSSNHSFISPWVS